MFSSKKFLFCSVTFAVKFNGRFFALLISSPLFQNSIIFSNGHQKKLFSVNVIGIFSYCVGIIISFLSKSKISFMKFSYSVLSIHIISGIWFFTLSFNFDETRAFVISCCSFFSNLDISNLLSTNLSKILPIFGSCFLIYSAYAFRFLFSICFLILKISFFIFSFWSSESHSFSNSFSFSQSSFKSLSWIILWVGCFSITFWWL